MTLYAVRIQVSQVDEAYVEANSPEEALDKVTSGQYQRLDEGVEVLDEQILGVVDWETGDEVL